MNTLSSHTYFETSSKSCESPLIFFKPGMTPGFVRQEGQAPDLGTSNPKHRQWLRVDEKMSKANFSVPFARQKLWVSREEIWWSGAFIKKNLKKYAILEKNVENFELLLKTFPYRTHFGSPTKSEHFPYGGNLLRRGAIAPCPIWSHQGLKVSFYDISRLKYAFCILKVNPTNYSA